MVVVVKRAQALVHRDRQSKSLRDSLDGEFAKLLKFVSFHNYEL